MSAGNAIEPGVRERLIRLLAVACGESASDETPDLKTALEELDAIAGEPGVLPPHLLHQLRKRSYGKALQTLRTEK